MIALRSIREDAVPVGMIVWHNHVQPTRSLGSRGFRAWVDEPDPEKFVVCDCGWAPELGTHYRVAKRAR